MNTSFLIRHLYPHTTTTALGQLLGLSVGQVYHRASALGVSKSLQYRVWRKRKTNLNLTQGGIKTRFTPGQTPPNKGEKMHPEIYARVQRTMFKKGNKPSNTKFDGCISIRPDNSGRSYKYIRLAQAKWELLHRIVWEQNFGAIPQGMIVSFKDNNSLNCDPSNLELLTQEQNMLRNSILNNYPPELVQAIRTNAGLKRRIKNLEYKHS